MALNCGIHYKTIALISSDLKVSKDFWSRFWAYQKIGLNFDGELFGSSLTLQQLINYGFKGPDEEGSNCWLNYYGSKGYPIPDWLITIKVIPDDDKTEPFEAFTTGELSKSDLVECARTGLIYVRDINSRWVFPEERPPKTKKVEVLEPTVDLKLTKPSNVIEFPDR